MAWTPSPRDPEANFEEPIIDKILEVVERDFKGALNYYFPTENYPDFRERTVGQIFGLNYPAFAVGPRSNAITDADDGSHLIQLARLSIRIAVTGNTDRNVTELIMRYTKVMQHVLRKARHELFDGLSNGFGLILGVENNYGPTSFDKTDNSVLFRAAYVDVVVNVREL